MIRKPLTILFAFFELHIKEINIFSSTYYMGNSQKYCIFQVTVKYYQRMIKLLEFLFMEL